MGYRHPGTTGLEVSEAGKPGSVSDPPGAPFSLEMVVRDYECDLQGIVNNANYQHYLEHTRHRFLRSIGVNYADLHRRGKDLMVTRIEMDFRIPLRGGDRFEVLLSVTRKGRLRFVFSQTIRRLPDQAVALEAVVTGVCVQDGRPVVLEELVQALSPSSAGLVL